MPADNQDHQRIAPDNDKTTEKNNLFNYRHGPRSIFPELWCTVIGPAFQGCSWFRIMRTVRAHDPYFNKSEIGDDKNNPGNQQPSGLIVDAGTPQKKRWQCNKQKMNKIFPCEMTVNCMIHRTAVTGICLTCHNGLFCI